MIQRIQSLYLLVVVISCSLLFFFPMIDYVGQGGTYKLFVTGMRAFPDNNVILFFWEIFPLLVLVIISMVLAIAAIFLYKKRRLQFRVVNLNVMINIVMIALVFLVYSRIFQPHLSNPVLTYQFGMYVPLISLVFLILASRAIRKDESLVKSTDRLR